MKTLLPVKPYLFLLIHGPTGIPYSIRLDVKKLVYLYIILATVFSAFIIGTLLFFRELENSRKLQERILDYEVRERIAESLKPILPPRTSELTSTSVPVVKGAAPIEKPENQGETSSLKEPTFVQTRMSGIESELVGDSHKVRLSLSPSGTGIAEGSLLVVLETEIPRIGSATPGTQIRKRYFIYPGNVTRDSLDPNELEELERKPFRFSRALQTTVDFNTGRLLRPLGINVYLFDKDDNLVLHERKPIETLE